MVTITCRTKISEIIKSNPASIEAIAAAAKPLEKLKNPLLRKIMAPRVTLSQAAAIGGCDLNDLLAALSPLGFKYEQDTMESPGSESNDKPGWLLSIEPDKILEIDVRSDIHSGADPLKSILAKFASLTDGQALCVINSFTPYPLINLLSKQSLVYTAESDCNQVHSWFLKRMPAEAAASKPADAGVHMQTRETFVEAVASFDENYIHRVDVRGLSAPEPMHRILNELASLPTHHALYVYHNKVPVYLLEELLGQRLTIHILYQQDGDVRLFIHINRPSK